MEMMEQQKTRIANKISKKSTHVYRISVPRAGPGTVGTIEEGAATLELYRDLDFMTGSHMQGPHSVQVFMGGDSGQAVVRCHGSTSPTITASGTGAAPTLTVVASTTSATRLPNSATTVGMATPVAGTKTAARNTQPATGPGRCVWIRDPDRKGPSGNQNQPCNHDIAVGRLRDIQVLGIPNKR